MAWDPYMAALMMQGAANSVGNLANASRGQRSIPANNVPLISAMMQRKNFLNAKEQIGADQTLPEDKRQSLISMMGIAPDAATEQYAKYKFPEAKSGLQVVGGSLIDTSDPNNIRELYKSGSDKPIIEEFQEGTQRVQKQWDARTGQWVPVGRGPMWNPKAGSGRGGGGGGTTMKERLMSKYIDLEERRAMGNELTPREEATRRFLEQQFSSVRTSGGDIVSLRPPSLFDTADETDDTEAMGGSEETSGPRVNVVREAPKTSAELKLESEIESAEATAKRATQIVNKMAANLAEKPSIAGFTGFVQRAKELVAGNLSPGASQPARDFAANLEELRGLSWKALLNDIRLAKDDREVLERMTSGTDAWSTPQDAVNTLNRIQSVLSKYEKPMSIDDIAKKHGKTVEEVKRDLRSISGSDRGM